MAPEMSLVVRRVTFLLVALSAAAVEVAALDTRAVGVSLGLASIWIAVAVAAGQFVPVPADPRRRPPRWVFLLLFGLATVPFGVEPLRRDWTGDGYPVELQMVFGLRNVGLGLAVCGGWFLCLRLACVASLFLTLFAAAMTSHPAALLVLGLYTATGSVWLMLVYWNGLKAVLVAPEKAVAVEVLPGRGRPPWAALCLLVLAVGGGLALAVVGPKRAALALGELVPTSGGSGGTDPFARHGVGDGPEETAGDDAKAAGMVETDRMIEDNKNALVDAVSDTYGPPHKPPKDQERAVAAGKVDVIQFHGKLPDNRRPSRDFDTSRKGPKGDKKPSSLGARGLFEVEGRTPLHVRLVAYGLYDAAGRRWIEARKPGSKLIESEGGDWMRVGHLKGAADWYQADEQHKLKAADMRDNLVPTPALLTRFRINRVNRPDYYEWAYEGVLALTGRTRTPPGVVVSTDSRTLDPTCIPETAFSRALQASTPASELLGELPAAVRADIDRLAREWAGDRQRGWPQVEAVVTKLHTEYTFDPAVAAPPDHAAPVAWFLTESRRGPDYLFATAAALLLRSLDYQSRVCLGYYVSPEAYDPETAHTPVRATDLHTWPEVRLEDGHWVVVEPTPGYEVLAPKLPWVERTRRALVAVGVWVRLHAVEVAVTVVTLIVAWVRRRELLDAAAVRVWRWRPGRTWREQVRRAVRVLERRGRWAGRPRPARQTTRSWLRGVQPGAADCGIDFDRLTRMAEWATYAPDLPPPWPEADVLALCRRVLDGWPLRRWRKAVVADSGMGA